MTDDESDGGGDERLSTTRRRFVATGAAGWATVSLAGCSRVLDPSSRDGGSTGGSGGSSGDGNDGSSSGDGDDGGSSGDGDDDGSSDDDDDGGSDDGQTTPTGNTTVTNETTTTDQPETETTEVPTTSCASSKQFAPGMEIGLHVNVLDTLTGVFLGGGEVDRVVVEFPYAAFEPMELNWEGDHEAYDTTTWGGKIETSEDIEPGTYRYEITVEGESVESQTVVDEFTIV